jgi:hypothetical protein
MGRWGFGVALASIIFRKEARRPGKCDCVASGLGPHANFLQNHARATELFCDPTGFYRVYRYDA